VKPVEIVFYPVRGRPVESITAELEPGEGFLPVERALDDLAQLAHQSLQEGRLQQAQTLCEALIALGRRDCFTHSLLGTVHLARRKLDEALVQFEAALSFDPEDLPSLVYRAEVRLARRKVLRAEQDLKRVLRLGSSADPFVKRAKKLLALTVSKSQRLARVR
jgi:tetratricopeptide (TPR) repeat protein